MSAPYLAVLAGPSRLLNTRQAIRQIHRSARISASLPCCSASSHSLLNPPGCTLTRSARSYSTVPRQETQHSGSTSSTPASASSSSSSAPIPKQRTSPQPQPRNSVTSAPRNRTRLPPNSKIPAPASSPTSSFSAAASRSHTPRQSQPTDDSQWAWQRSKTKDEDVITETRVIFERPSRFNWSNSFLFPAGLVVVTSLGYGYFIYNTWTMPTEEYNMILKEETWISKISRDLAMVAYPPLLLFGIWITASTIKIQRSAILNLSQIRIRPSHPSKKTPIKDLIGIRHSLHPYTPWSSSRTVPQDKIKLYDLNTGTIRLDIDLPSKRPSWNKGFYLIFRITDEVKDPSLPLVLSRSRLEEVFGKVYSIPESLIKEENKPGKVLQWLDKVMKVKK